MNTKKQVVVSEIINNVFVRRELNLSHAAVLGDMIISGTELPPILVSQNNELIDGRHRIAAYQLLGKEVIMAEIRHVKDEVDLIEQAYRANTGGSLPPTQADSEHTIRMLLDRRVSMKEISEKLGLPVDLTRKWAKQVKTKDANQRIAQAVHAVREKDMPLSEAAKEHGVEVEVLRDRLDGRKNRKTKASIKEILAALSTNHRSLSKKDSSQRSKLLELYEDGKASRADVFEVIEKIESLNKRGDQLLKDFKKRFENVAGKVSKQAA